MKNEEKIVFVGHFQIDVGDHSQNSFEVKKKDSFPIFRGHFSMVFEKNNSENALSSASCQNFCLGLQQWDYHHLKAEDLFFLLDPKLLITYVRRQQNRGKQKFCFLAQHSGVFSCVSQVCSIHNQTLFSSFQLRFAQGIQKCWHNWDSMCTFWDIAESF